MYNTASRVPGPGEEFQVTHARCGIRIHGRQSLRDGLTSPASGGGDVLVIWSSPTPSPAGAKIMTEAGSQQAGPCLELCGHSTTAMLRTVPDPGPTEWVTGLGGGGGRISARWNPGPSGSPRNLSKPCFLCKIRLGLGEEVKGKVSFSQSFRSGFPKKKASSSLSALPILGSEATLCFSPTTQLHK